MNNKLMIIDKEAILRAWLTGDNLEKMDSNYNAKVFTCEYNGVTLSTRCRRVMERPSSFAPYQEVDGLLYEFTKDDKTVLDWNGELDPNAQRNSPNGYSSTFEYFIKNYGHPENFPNRVN